MRIPNPLTISVVWLATVLVAFALGRSFQLATQSNDGEAAPAVAGAQSMDTMQDAAGTAHSDTTSDGEVPADSLGGASDSTRTLAQLAAAFSKPTSDPKRAASIRELLIHLAEAQPEIALMQATQIASLRDRQRAVLNILEVWGASKPYAALAWAESHSAHLPQKSLQRQLRAIYRGMAKADPTQAFAQALSMPEDDSITKRRREQMLSQVIETQVRNGGLGVARATIEAMDEGDTKNRLLSELIHEWASYDPTRAADYVLSLGDSASTRMKHSLLREWAESDPVAASGWLSALDPDDPTLGRATPSIIREWAQYDLTASAEWLNTLPASPALDRAVASYTYRAAQEDPATAMGWAESVNNERTKGFLVERVAAYWKEQDPSAFAAYLETGGFSDADKERLTNARFHGGHWSRNAR